MKFLSGLLHNKRETLLVICLLLIATTAHGYNMLHFPYFENDEGSYSSYAWALVTKGELSPYTYWYDHAPAGWILIGAWILLTGGISAFGFSLYSGRILMLILQVLSAGLLYIIAKRFTKSQWMAAVSVLIFSISPLGIYFQRRILLDNIMTFWVLVSLAFLLYYKNKLRNIIWSAITFGIAILSKENAIFWIPIFLYIIYLESHGKHKSFALVKWIAIMGMVVFLYFLYAMLKGELFPTGTFLGGTNEHVSLLGTLREQFSRGGGGILNMKVSSFWQNVWIWLEADPVVTVSGAVATIITFLIGIRNKTARVISLLALSMWAFLMRGGLVIEFYILPLLPFLGLNIAYVLWFIREKLKGTPLSVIRNVPLAIFTVLFIGSSLYYATNIRQNLNLYTSDQTTAQLEAIDWILNQKTKRFYVVDNYGLIDLWVRNNNNFRRAEWYWKVDHDPAIRDTVLKNSPKDIDFIAMTPQMQYDISVFDFSLTAKARNNAKPVTKFWNDGWGVEFWATNYPTRVLESSWESYKKKFITNGRVSDPAINNDTTSEGQSYAMLRSVWLNDRVAFDTAWQWTQKHLQQEDTNLFSWKWTGTDEEGNVIDQGTATDADQDIALALLFAHKRWKNQVYLTEAQKIINGMWEEEVVIINGMPYITAANWADQGKEVVVNPSYLSPVHYRIFAQADKNHAWIQAVDTSYAVLTACTQAKLDKTKGVLPPEWCSIDKSTLKAGQPPAYQPHASEYGYNAFRVPWRIALDYNWYNEPRAKTYLATLNTLYNDYKKTGKVVAAYQHDGRVWENYESAAAYGGNIGFFQIVHPDEARVLYNEKLLQKFYEDKDSSYWDDPNNYYTQNWAWFGTALYTYNLPNLWLIR